MIPIKTQEQIEIMREGGKKLSFIISKLLQLVKPGVKGEEIESLACALIKKSGGQPSFKMVKGYHWATCINKNEGVVHGIPEGITINDGDIVSIDLGLFYKGLNTDMADTLKVKSEKLKVKSEEKEIEKFLGTGERALEKTIAKIKPGVDLSEISKTMQSVVEGNGYSCVRELTGHGVGVRLHEEPIIPCFFDEEQKWRVILREGMTLAIEIIYAFGKPDLVRDNDGWTIRTLDGKISALFEKTVAVTPKGVIVLTPWFWEDEKQPKS